jgi:hypothetical protein
VLDVQILSHGILLLDDLQIRTAKPGEVPNVNAYVAAITGVPLEKRGEKVVLPDPVSKNPDDKIIINYVNWNPSVLN